MEQKYRRQEDDYDLQEELQNNSVSPMVKPTPGKNMFNFGSMIENVPSKSPSTSPDKSNGLTIASTMPLSPDSEAVPMVLPGKQGKGNREGAASTAQEKKRPPLAMSLHIDDSQEEDNNDQDRDSDGQNSPELIIPKPTRGPRQQNLTGFGGGGSHSFS